MREWLTVIIVLLIVTVVLDGLRRMRNNRRSAIRMSLSMHQGTKKADLEVYGSELPNGGARVANVREVDAAKEFNHKVKETRRSKVSRTGRPYRIPEQVSLNLDEHVPMLMDSVEHQHKADAKRRVKETEAVTDDEISLRTGERIEPSFDDDDLDTFADEREQIITASSDDDDDVSGTDKYSGHKYRDDQDDYDDDVDSASDDDYDDEEDEEEFLEPEDVLVLNVMAHKGDYFAGDHLLDIVIENGMRFGSMNIFHHHEQTNGDGSIWYSMANIVKPGTFDLNQMSDFVTPGVSLFMTLPMHGDSKKAFEAMLTTAKAIAYELDGELKDENRSVLTPQTIEHYRTRIKEFERKQLSKTPA